MIGSFKQMDKKRRKLDDERPQPRLTHPVFKKTWFHVCGSVLTGVLLALSFPPYANSTLIFAALVPLMFAVHAASPKKAAWLGLLSGFVFFMLSLSWLTNLTGMVPSVGLKLSAFLGYLVLSAYCALYVVPFALVVALATKQWAGENLHKNLRLMFSITMVWVGMEYLRGFLFSGFPWNPLGVSQYANPAIIQIAEWGGVQMVSAYIVWMNAAIFITFRQYTHGSRVRKYRPHFELMIGILPIALSVAHGMNVLFNCADSYDAINVALIQPNIPQAEKWNRELEMKIRENLEQLTEAAARLEDVDLLIWPETAVPSFIRLGEIDYDIVQRATQPGIPLLAGTMDFGQLGEEIVYFNSSILFDGEGHEVAKYDKQHLVPLGEYVPFPAIMGKFTPVNVDFLAGKQSTLLPLRGHASFSVLICFEDTVAPLAVNATRAGARWLVNQTNDAWFDPSAQSEQHLAHAVFRCIENRIPMARCCNTGVSCVIDAYGSIDQKLDVRTRGFTVGEINPRPIGLEQTFYTRHGNAFGKVALIAGATVLFVLRTKGWRKRKMVDRDQ
jgi:apolipoprotein N-acyltransferase